jgi:4-amino-4-deoxy-L-arabinose transferase-like glycosyltransferase
MLASDSASMSAWHVRCMLLVVLLGAGLLRLAALDEVPPGLHQDEAVNAWNAYCLLHTGRDQAGVSWPIFYTRALGENRSTLFMYTLLPFQALAGMNTWTMRLPAALAGLLTVGLLYHVGRRLFGPATGLAAAALLAINPTHIQLTRWGHEAALNPLLTLAPLAALLWAGLPGSDRDATPRPRRAALAGLLTGLCCYGYPAVRLLLPAFLAASVAVTWRSWHALLTARGGRRTLVAYVLTLAATAGPLAAMHVLHPEAIGKRGQTTWIWSPDDPPATRVAKVLARHASHFAPDFLFAAGDADETAWTVPFGFLPWYYAPLLALGVGVCVARWRRSPAVRLLLVGVVLFPVGDALNWHISLHALRSTAGLWPLVLLAALGLTATLGALARRRLRASLAVAVIGLLAIIVPQTVAVLQAYFQARARQLPVYYGTHTDLVSACAWLRPRLSDVDAVICFAAGPNPGYTPYIVMLVALDHDPHAWHTEPREVDTTGTWDHYRRYGRFYFVDGAARAAVLAELRANDRPDRVVIFARPDQDAYGPPAASIRTPTGEPAVLIYDCRL